MNLDNLALNTGWKYNLNVVKDIKVTEDFLDLDSDVRKCNRKGYADCKTRAYLDGILQNCGCLPLSLMLKDSNV